MTDEAAPTVSVVIPAKDEAGTLPGLVAAIRDALPDAEIIVVNDGSSDDSGAVAAAAGATVIDHPYSKGNGAAVKTGARAAHGEILVMLDADGQHDPGQIPLLLEQIAAGYDLVVGARTTRADQASAARWGANRAYNFIATVMVGHPVADLTSGFRAVRRALFLDIIGLLPNGFSYPTTSTMAFFRAGHNVGFVPVNVAHRGDKASSHIRPLRDGGRFLLIIFKVATLYAPLKIFAPLAGLLFGIGLGYYAYTFATLGRFTNMGAVLLIGGILVFLFGLISEQITMLAQARSQQRGDPTRRD